MALDRWLRVAWLRIRSIVAGRALDRELDDELADHLEQEVSQQVARGRSPAEARRAALIAMGGISQRREACRDQRGLRLLEDTSRDVRHAVRALRRAPGFAAVAVTVLALGIGANTAMFSVLNGVLFRPLPYPDADRLFMLSSTQGRGPFGSGRGLADSKYLVFRQVDQLFEDVGTFGQTSVNLTGSGEPLRVPGALVTPSIFSVLKTNPALGRVFAPDEDQPGRNRVVVLSDALWRSQFGADPGIVGTDITLDGVVHQVIGVLPHPAAFPANARVWLPLTVGADLPGNSWTRMVIGRLKRGATVEQARAELLTVAGPAENASEADRARWRTDVLPLKDLIVGDARQPLGILAGVVAFVLLIACANVANVVLVRTSARSREFALRTSLGASRSRLVRQLLVESIVVSLLGGACGAVLAYWGLPALLSLAPAGVIPRTDLIRMDLPVLTFTCVLSAVTGVIFGLVPAVHATRPGRALAESSRTFTGGQERLRGALVVVEIALALILLTGAGLMMKSLLRLGSVDPGFRADDVMTMTVELPGATYRNAPAVRAFHDETLARMVRIPEIQSVAAVNWLPFGTQFIRGGFAIDGGRTPDFDAAKLAVSPGYFRTMSIALRQGRDFGEGDHASAPGVVIVSSTLARDLWPGESALDRQLAIDTPARQWLTVVGVVDDVKQQGLDSEAVRAIYQPYPQVTRVGWLSHMTFVVKAAGRPPSVAAALRTAVRDVDPDQPILRTAWLDALIAGWSAQPRFQARLIGVFAGLALLLAVAGVYGVLSYVVARRTREIAIRVALGATRPDVWRLVLGRTALLASAGVALGTAGALGLTGLLRQYLFEVTPTDPITFGSVAGIMVATALAAGFVPAWRAARVNPTVALQSE